MCPSLAQGAIMAKSNKLDQFNIYLSKHSKVIYESDGGECDLSTVATACQNLKALGYVFSQELFEQLRASSRQQVVAFVEKLVPQLKALKGAHRTHKPMYPNFPTQVMEMEEAQLYLNAMLHYWGSFISDVVGDPSLVMLPQTEVEERPKLDEETKLLQIKLGSKEDFEGIFTRLSGANTSLSETDKDILKWFCENLPEPLALLPDSIPQKETLAMLAVHLGMPDAFCKQLRTATDVLRVAVVLCGGDVSLAAPTKFKGFSRKTRRFLLQSMEGCNSLTEDMLRYRENWLRLGEALHPSEYKARFPKTHASFNVIRNNVPFETFNGLVERLLLSKETSEVVDVLKSRPGDFARRLDHVLRVGKNSQLGTVDAFLDIANQAATPLLLQVYQHFLNREKISKKGAIRTFFPKGAVAKMQVSEKPLPRLPQEVCDRLSEGVRNVLVRRFSSGKSLGRCYIDPSLKTMLIPTAQRSASKAMRTLSRGSNLELQANTDTLRFFIWWKNGNDRVDIDLTAAIFNEDFDHVTDISYYNLKSLGACHSGDITSAPNGASEFIDVSISKALKSGRYVAMSVYGFSGQPFCDLPECFAGWMSREHANSGEIFEPKTVENRIDVTSNSRICVPAVFDLKERRVIWADLAVNTRSLYASGFRNSRSVGSMVKAIAKLNRPSLYDLFLMHVQGRGELVERKEDADLIFSMEEGITPYDADLITSEYMA
jgi:hypothetical protein